MAHEGGCQSEHFAQTKYIERGREERREEGEREEEREYIEMWRDIGERTGCAVLYRFL